MFTLSRTNFQIFFSIAALDAMLKDINMSINLEINARHVAKYWILHAVLKVFHKSGTIRISCHQSTCPTQSGSVKYYDQC